MHNKPWQDWVPGVLCDEQLKIMIEQGFIQCSGEINYDDIGYSSFDLHLSDEVYLMKEGAIKPNGGHYSQNYLNDFEIAEKQVADERGYYLLDKSNTYVVKLMERLAYINEIKKAELHGRATAKSTIGRVDVLARLIIDGMYEYESFEPHLLENSNGEMFLEITPITFKVIIKPKISLSQLRLFLGKPEDSEIKSKILYKNSLRTPSELEKDDESLSVSLIPEIIKGKSTVAFRAKNTEKEIELWGREKYTAEEFWDLVEIQNINSIPDHKKRMVIQKEYFYILKSDEKISLPPSIAVYCKAMDESLGEMRIHYAGFVHPYFGYQRDDRISGTPLIFEVRGHDLLVNLLHREKLAKLIFYRMSQTPVKKKEEDYEKQTLKLSKFFISFGN